MRGTRAGWYLSEQGSHPAQRRTSCKSPPVHPPPAVRPGEEITLTGIYTHSFEASTNARQGFPVYSTNIEANHVAKKGDQYSSAKLTDDDKAEIRALARDPRIGGCNCGGGAVGLTCADWQGGGVLMCVRGWPAHQHPLLATPLPPPPCFLPSRTHRQEHCALYLWPRRDQAGHRAGSVWGAGEAPIGHAPPARGHQHAAAGRPRWMG